MNINFVKEELNMPFPCVLNTFLKVSLILYSLLEELDIFGNSYSKYYYLKIIKRCTEIYF